jgi:hypothetical protein
MAGDKAASVERIVQELLAHRHEKPERMRLLRELVRSGEDVPDALLEAALRKLMERIPE